jgi:hypothetical protein
MKKNEILTKKPFVRVTPNGYLNAGMKTELTKTEIVNDKLVFQIVSQADFIREFYPTGHRINSPDFYPDRIKYDEETKRFFTEKVMRVAFPFQMIITIQQLVHLCGNLINHELTDAKVNNQAEDDFLLYKKGWLDKNIEIAFYEFAKSIKITGDGAICLFMDNGRVGTRNFSYLDGDKLYPHYNSITGRLEYFARRYTDYDDRGEEMTDWVEVWDEKFLYRYKQTKTGVKGAVNSIIARLGITDPYVLDSQTAHQFNEVPIVYHRDKHGPCWTFAQENIDMFELAVSHLCQNNMAYAFPIMILKGENITIQGDMYGAVKAITMGADDSADFMKQPQASEAFKLQLDTLLKMIFMGGFAVVPPEVRSGDLPGVAVKLIYSPSMEKAITDCKEFDKAIDTLARLFLFGYGIETQKTTAFAQLHVRSKAVPYIHQNTAELINTLMQSVTSGFLSAKTASELSGYGKNNEFDQIMRELKEQQQHDLLTNPT